MSFHRRAEHLFDSPPAYNLHDEGSRLLQPGTEVGSMVSVFRCPRLRHDGVFLWLLVRAYLGSFISFDAPVFPRLSLLRSRL